MARWIPNFTKTPPRLSNARRSVLAWISGLFRPRKTFRKVGKSDFDSLTIAKSTGVKANKKNPKTRSITNENTPEVKINTNNRIGFIIADIKRTFFLPTLSEIVPDRNVPPAPAN